MRKLFWSSFFLLVFVQFNCAGQTFLDSDFDQLIHSDFKPKESVSLFRPFSLSGKNLIAKYNPIKILAASSLFFYQNMISQQIGSNCPYHHSCSSFSKLCIERHGLIKGVFLTADRLTRCGQFGLKDIRYKSDFNSISKRIIDEPSFYE